MWLKSLTLIIFSLPLIAQANDIPGCNDLETTLALSQLSIESDGLEEKKLKMVTEAKKALCSRFTASAGSTVYYANGSVATYSARNAGATWYYSNGDVITYSAGRPGSTWYYPNGNVVSYSMGKKDSTLYYFEGDVFTYSFGKSGATWYYPNGNVITYSVGRKGSTYYYPNGSVLTYSGPELTEEELLDPAKVLEELLGEEE